MCHVMYHCSEAEPVSHPPTQRKITIRDKTWFLISPMKIVPRMHTEDWLEFWTTCKRVSFNKKDTKSSHCWKMGMKASPFTTLFDSAFSKRNVGRWSTTFSPQSKNQLSAMELQHQGKILFPPARWMFHDGMESLTTYNIINWEE